MTPLLTRPDHMSQTTNCTMFRDCIQTANSI